MAKLNLTKTLKTMEILENKVTKILQEHHTIDESDSIEVTNLGVNYLDNEVLDIKIDFWLSLDDHRHTVTFLISKTQKKLDYCFIAGYIAKYIEDLEI